MAVFLLVSVMAFAGWQQVQRQREGSEKALQRLSSLERTIYWLDNDFQHYVNRSVINELGSPANALVQNDYGDYQIEITRNGWRNPGADSVDTPPRSSMVRVAYGLADGKLYRTYWPYVDRMDTPTPRKRFLMKDVTELAFRFLKADDEWATRWPPLSADPEQAAPSPKAIEITLTLKDFGRIQRLIAVPAP